jgi:DnaJ family protein C protein 25
MISQFHHSIPLPQAISKAYEILTNFEKRAEYDHFRDRPDEYFKKYGSSVLWAYAPKSDASIIIILFLLAGSAFTYYAQKNRWQTIANHLVRAATEDWSPREGGSKESTEIREKALAILAQKKDLQSGAVETNGTINREKKKKVPKMTPREKKEKEWEELRPICIDLVNEIDDFGAGFRKPTLQDLLVIRMVKWPFYVMNSALWWSKYAFRRLRKMDLNDEEREMLTKNAIGEVAWIAVSDEERANVLTLELWKSTDALVEWKEEQEFKRAGLSMTKMKQLKKMRKKGSTTEDDDLHMD